MKRYLFSFLIAILSNFAFAEELPAFSIEGQAFSPFTLENFISKVKQSSAVLLAKKLAVESAVAMQGPMGMPNINPSISLTRGSKYLQEPYVNYSAISPQSNTVSLSGTIEGWGKRGARSAYASAEVNRHEVELDTLNKNIDLDSANIFLDALRSKLTWQVIQKSINSLSSLGAKKAIDEEKVKKAIDAEKTFQANIKNDFLFFAHSLKSYTDLGGELLPDPVSNVNVSVTAVNKNTILDSALQNRTEILNLQALVKSADASLEMTKKNRNIDVTPFVSYTSSPAYTSSGTYYGPGQTISVGLSIPIPITLIYNADLVAAGNNKNTIELYLADAKRRITAEVNQAYLQYSFTSIKYKDAQAAFKDAATPTKTADSITNLRAKEVELIDAKVNHLKASLNLQRVGGIYEVPKF